jgi:anaerobic magnesium-protoporphyrin IX monomethyl ester cyclase
MPPQTLEQAIMRTVSYADIFNYPLTSEEIHRYLIEYPAPVKTVITKLDDLRTCEQLDASEGYYFLPGRADHVQTRHHRAKIAETLWPVAYDYGRRIAHLPFVQMVAVTGSLSVNNPDERGDIDYLIVTEPDRLWLVRLLVIGLVKLAQHQGVVLCPNYLVTTNALTFATQNIFTARELVQMIPLAGFETYQTLRDLNPWTADFMPNAAGSPPATPADLGTRDRLTAMSEPLLRLPPVSWLESWEMKRKIRKLTAQAPDCDEANFTADQCKGHFDHHMQNVLHAYVSRTDAPTMQENKVLFGQSYYLRFDQKLWDAMQPYPPLGTLYAASAIREQGYPVALFDAMLAEDERDWLDAIRREQPEYAVIYEDNFNYLSKMCLTRMREAAFKMIHMAKDWGCTVIVCGSDATDHHAQYIAEGADYVLIGEGEATLIDLLASLSGQQTTPPDTITGVVTATQPTPTRRPVMKDLDALPLPAWDLVDVEKYRAIWLERHGYFSMNAVTTRGCPYHCNWCAKPIWGQRYSMHSPAYVARHIQHLKETYQPDHIWFADDIMGLKPGWFAEFADELDARDARLPFKCLSRVDLLLRGDTITDLKRAGCDIVWVGAESGSQTVLDAMEKGTRVDDIRQAAERLHTAGVRVGFFLQFGYPGETHDDIVLTRQLVRDCQPDDIGMSVSYPLPGTPFHARVRDQLGDQHNWADSNDMAMLYEGPFTTGFYRQLHTVIHKEFRSRRTWQALQASLRQPGLFRRRYLRDAAAMIYHRLTLPLAQRKLNRLAQVPHHSVIHLQPGMDYAAAATPSPQDH